MVSRYHPKINKQIANFLTKYSSFRPVFNELLWLKSTDSQAMKGNDQYPCWVQQGNYTLSVVLNEGVLLRPEYINFVPFLICHEILHIMKSHFSRFSDLPEVKAVQGKLDQAIKDKSGVECAKLRQELGVLNRIFNIAADAAINSMFNEADRAPNGITPQTLKLPLNMSAEGYFQRLYQQYQDKKEQQEDVKLEDALGVNIVEEDPPEEGDSEPGSGGNSEDKSGEEPPDKPEGDSKEDSKSQDESDSTGDLGSGGKPDEDSKVDSEVGEGPKDPPKANKCTCGDPAPGARPCVHVFSEKKSEEVTEGDSSQEPKDSGEDDPQFDPAGTLNRAMEEGLKDLVSRPGECKLTEDDLRNIPEGNFKEVLAGARHLDAFQHRIVEDFKECEPFKWERLLSGFMKSGSKVDLKFSRKRRNRRYGTRPGVQIVQKKRVAFIIDTSCSMSTRKIETLKPIIDSLASIMDVIIIHCDTEVQHCEKWTARDFMDLKGGGGTRGVPAIKKAQQLKVDGAIYYTDGGFYDSSELRCHEKPVFNFIWLLVDVTKGSLSSSVRALPPWGQRVIVD